MSTLQEQFAALQAEARAEEQARRETLFRQRPPHAYADWIRAYVCRKAATTGLRQMCVFAAREMREVFPELVAVPGKVLLADGQGICHLWLVTPDGTVLDPTVLQFESPVVGYRPLADEDPPPTGQCLECWDWRYSRGGYCSDRCYRRAYRRRKKIRRAQSVRCCG